MKVGAYTGLIGGTPAMALGKLYEGMGLKGRAVAKLEMFNPMSIKDRAVLFMVRALEEAGKLKEGAEVVEASSGNTAIALAALGATMGFKARVFISEAVSAERALILKAYGATVVKTPAAEHTRGARERAMAYCAENRHAHFLNQHDNPACCEAHYETTGPEIWRDCGTDLGAVVLGLGTCGTFNGVARFIKEKNPAVKMIGFEPAASPVYSGGKQGEHHITGIGPGFVAGNFLPVRDLCDEIVLVKDEDAYGWSRQVALREGLLVGITSGAAAWAAGQVAMREEMAGKTVACVFYDTGERYLSVKGLWE